MTTTKFSNNVTRAKAVKQMAPNFGGKKPAINNYPGQTVPGKTRSLISGGPGAQMSVDKAGQRIKGA